MIIGDRLRALREEKKLSQGDIEKRTGLLRATSPASRMATPFRPSRRSRNWLGPSKCPLYQLFYDGEEPPDLPNLPKRKTADEIAWGSSGKEARFLTMFRRLLGRIDEGDRRLLLYMAQKMASR